MGVFRRIGRAANLIVGETAKVGVKLVSKTISIKYENVGQYVGEVGESVIEASKLTVDTVAQFADGTIQGAYGIVKKDAYHKQQGWEDIKDSTGRTAKGIGSGVVYTVKSAGTTINGIRYKDNEQILSGVKSLGKVVVVTTFAVGVLDVLDGADLAQAEALETRNAHLIGMDHTETGVSFVEKTVEFPNGELGMGVFPVFESKFSVILTEELYLENDNVHFQQANETLLQSIQADASIVKELGLSSVDIGALENGITPEGYVWHHSEEQGVLQLVEEEMHQQTGHTGGRAIWGGGSEFR